MKIERMMCVNKVKRAAAAVFAAAAVLSLNIAAMPGWSAENAAYTVTDVRGKEISFTSVPQRIATVGKPFPSIYFALEGNTDHIVGCHPSSITAYRESILRYMYPALAKAEAGWCSKNSTINVEELMKLQPDVVFCYSTADKEIRKMEEAGLKVVALRSAEMESILENLRIMGKVCRKEERAEDLIRCIEEKTAETASKLKGVSEKDKPCVVEFYGDMNVSVRQYDHWMIPSGSRNPAALLTGKLADVEMEQILLWNPDIIYIGNHTDLMPSDLLENKQKGRDWSIVNAVKNRRVYKIPIGAYRWDPSGVDPPLMIKWAAKIQYPEIFADLDMRNEVREFFKYVYKFELTDEMLGEILDNRQK